MRLALRTRRISAGSMRPRRDFRRAAFAPGSMARKHDASRSRFPQRKTSLSELQLQAVQHLIARQHLGDARVRLAALANGGEEFAILQLDSVHRHVDPGYVDLFFLAVEEIVVAGDVGAGIADVAK